MERQDLKPQVAGLRIPTFKVTWDEEVSPFVEQAEARMVEWANRFNLLVDEHYRKRVDRTRYGWLAARVWPLAEPELLQVLCDFMLWFFLVDDLFVDRVETITDDTLRNLTAMIDVLDFDRAGPEPVWGELAWVDICDRLRRLLPSEVFERFAQGMRLWATCAALQILNHLRPKPVGMREYQTIRRHTSGMNPCISLSGMVGAEEYYRPEVQKLMMHTNNIVCWANDIQSLAIEISQPGQYRNMVVIHTMKGCDLQEAVDWTAAQVEGEIKAFTELADAVSKDPSASAGLIEFVTGMKYWIRGYLDWVALDTKRYATEYVAHDADDRHISLAV